MSKYTFLHNLELQKKFDPFDYSKNVSEVHKSISISEIDILNLIQIPFDWTRSWDALPRYEISEEYCKEFLYPKTWSLLNVDTKWNRENIKKGALFLANHLDYLPEYIIDAAYSIMGECLGYKVHNRRFILPKNNQEYNEFLELGKYHLAVFMLIIEELGRLGIDCRAIKMNTNIFYIGCKIARTLDGKSSLYDIRRNFKVEEYPFYNKNHSITENDKLVERDFYFEIDKVHRQLTFNDLEEFFIMLIDIVDRLCSFNSLMPDPKSLDFTKFYYENAALPNSYALPLGPQIDVKTCLKEFLARLQKGELINLYYQEQRNIDVGEPDIPKNNAPKDLSVNTLMPIDPKMLREFIKFLFAKNYIYITPSKTLAFNDSQNITAEVLTAEVLTHDFLNANPVYYPKNHADDYYNIVYFFYTYLIKIKEQSASIALMEPFNSSNASDSSEEEIIGQLVNRIIDLEKRQANLEEKVDTLSDEFADLKRTILNYLETGENKPDFSTMNMDIITEILKNAEVKTVGARIRKRLLLMAIALGMVGLLKSSNPGLGTLERPNFDNNDSSVVQVDPPLSSEEQVNTIISIKPEITPSPEEKIDMHILEENTGERNYYISIYDQARSGITNQTGYIIRYFAFQNGTLVATIGTEAELQEFIKSHNIEDLTWKAAVSCLDYDIIKNYIESGAAISLEYTTFFTDYVPVPKVMRAR